MGSTDQTVSGVRTQLAPRNRRFTTLADSSVENETTRTVVTNRGVAENAVRVYDSTAYTGVADSVDVEANGARETVTRAVVAGSAVGVAESACVSVEVVANIAAETRRRRGSAGLALRAAGQTGRARKVVSFDASAAGVRG